MGTNIKVGDGVLEFIIAGEPLIGSLLCVISDWGLLEGVVRHLNGGVFLVCCMFGDSDPGGRLAAWDILDIQDCLTGVVLFCCRVLAARTTLRIS